MIVASLDGVVRLTSRAALNTSCFNDIGGLFHTLYLPRYPLWHYRAIYRLWPLRLKSL